MKPSQTIRATGGTLLEYLIVLCLVGLNCWAEEAFRAEKLAQMDEAILQAIQEQNCPGGVLWVEHRGNIYHKAYGNRALVPEREAMTEDTIFDLASLTKVTACTPAI